MPMPSKFLIGHLSDGLVIRVVGCATMRESPAFRAAVEPNLDAGNVLFDATQCDYVDSTFLGCLIGIKKACELLSSRRFVIAACAATRIRNRRTSSTCFDRGGVLPSTTTCVKSRYGARSTRAGCEGQTTTRRFRVCGERRTTHGPTKV